mmetsp:Transcript_11992/g.23280  ORF Transcript_11992/g.23280 Transcript_11992/m.23280 type:complete len:229 (-) Transcript_11992:220-906(-)
MEHHAKANEPHAFLFQSRRVWHVDYVTVLDQQSPACFQVKSERGRNSATGAGTDRVFLDQHLNSGNGLEFCMDVHVQSRDFQVFACFRNSSSRYSRCGCWGCRCGCCCCCSNPRGFPRSFSIWRNTKELVRIAVVHPPGLAGATLYFDLVWCLTSDQFYAAVEAITSSLQEQLTKQLSCVHARLIVSYESHAIPELTSGQSFLLWLSSQGCVQETSAVIVCLSAQLLC